ncbi:MAG: ABC transporter ATP-binding protein [Gemmatimonadetes bacterium]|nr:ABC transporter ATP-binding protein [Gemmatimonadota bacterium]
MDSARRDGFFSQAGLGVSVAGLTKRYRTAAEEIYALHGIDWEVAPGDAVAIMGPSGCGKTTLLNLLAGVDRASGGSVVVGGEDLTRAPERALEEYRLLRVGFVFQLFNLVPTISALENLEMPMMIRGVPADERRARAESLLATVGIAEKAAKRPEELSGGEQQRVAVALALANDPALILADEPTGNLDSENAIAITRLLLSLSADHGKTVILVSHDAAVVRQFPKVSAMRDGRFVRSANSDG